MAAEYECCCEHHFYIGRFQQPGAQEAVNIWLTQHVGGHPQQCVQQIVDLSVPLHDVGKLLIVHKLHVGPRVRGHMLTHKGKVNETGKCWGKHLESKQLELNLAALMVAVKHSHCPPENGGTLCQTSLPALTPSRSGQVWPGGFLVALCQHAAMEKLMLAQKKAKRQSRKGAWQTYLNMVWPSGSFLILFRRFTNARCPVVSPSTATMSVESCRLAFYKQQV